MKKPDFFLVGAPKGGTTALSDYLGLHPQVFMCLPKEPNYFATDLPGLRHYVDTLAGYERLFAAASDRHIAVGEASSCYLYSREAIASIRQYNPAARLVVMLRNPFEVLISYHAQLLFCLLEDETDITKAWRLQSLRRQGQHIPPRCREPAMLNYREALALGVQLERLYRVFPADQVTVIFFDDFKRSPRAVYDELLVFLQLPPDHREEFPVVNAYKRVRYSWLNVLVHNPPIWAITALKTITGTRLHTMLLRTHLWLKQLNAVSAESPKLSADLRAEVAAPFCAEISLMERITGHDLSAWRDGYC